MYRGVLARPYIITLLASPLTASFLVTRASLSVPVYADSKLVVARNAGFIRSTDVLVSVLSTHKEREFFVKEALDTK